MIDMGCTYIDVIPHAQRWSVTGHGRCVEKKVIIRGERESWAVEWN